MSQEPLPEWASFFTPERFAIFVERLHHALDAQGIRYELDLQDGSWRYLEEDSKVYGLVNLAQVCNQMPMDDWDAEIGPFLKRIRQGHSEDDVPADFETVRPILRVRLFASESVDASILVTRPVAAGFVTCLAVDLPDKILTVSRERADGYGVPVEELFRIALENVVRTAEVETKTFQIGDGAEIVSLGSSDFFTASLALDLDRLIGSEPALGRLVAVPSRHQVLAAPLDAPGSLASLGPLVHAAREMFRDGPGSISPYVYWVRGGHWERLEVELTEQGVGVEGPDLFVQEVLRRLLE